MKLPCRDCITYAICKSQIMPYLEENNRKVSAIGLLQTLDMKCNEIGVYVRKTRESENQSLLSHMHECLIKIFKDE
jgi:hypothetical protein